MPWLVKDLSTEYNLLEPLALKQLTGSILAKHERLSLITTLFLDHDRIQTLENLSGEAARTFIDVVDEASDHVVSH